MKLSHSAKELFDFCKKAYKLKYIDKYRELTLSSALVFGTAFGDTVQMIILDKKSKLTTEESDMLKLDPKEFFIDKMTNVKHNGNDLIVPKSSIMRYFRSDWTPEILDEEDLLDIKKYQEELGIQEIVTMDMLQSEMKLNNLDNDEISLMNYIYWKSLIKKGLSLIDEYRKEIYPRIKKVYEIEGKIKIENSTGDEITGFLDLVVDFECDDGVVRKILFDHKTSSSRYGKNAIFDKKQLLLYNYDREVDLLGYIIGIKKLKTPKRGPRKGESYFEIQVIIGETVAEAEESLIAEYDEVLTAIKAEEFEKTEDKNSCKFRFGKKCPYYDICYKNDDSGLFKKTSTAKAGD